MKKSLLKNRRIKKMDVQNLIEEIKSMTVLELN
ncbi:MAG: DUF29 family protein, partial [Clostridia bacterium]|nr:DUF29 family protein [Clostridia bacterium]